MQLHISFLPLVLSTPKAKEMTIYTRIPIFDHSTKMDLNAVIVLLHCTPKYLVSRSQTLFSRSGAIAFSISAPLEKNRGAYTESDNAPARK